MKKIIIYYWKELNLIPKYKHEQEFDYSTKKRNEIIHMVLEHGFSIMVKPYVGGTEDTLLIFISKNNFSQY